MRELLVQGFVGKDAELGQTKDGKPTARFSVAYTDNKGTPEEVTTWYRVTAFATTLQGGGYVYKTASEVKKGDHILLRGNYRTRLYNNEVQHELTAGILTQLPKLQKKTTEAPF